MPTQRGITVTYSVECTCSLDPSILAVILWSRNYRVTDLSVEAQLLRAHKHSTTVVYNRQHLRITSPDLDTLVREAEDIMRALGLTPQRN